MANNQEMFDKAKHESEIIFKNALLSTYRNVIVPGYGYVRFQDIIHVDEDMKVFDCEYHVDVIARAVYENRSHEMWLFDVKDVEDKWIYTGNYSIPHDQVYFYMNSLNEHWIAFRLNDGISKKFNKFCIVKAYDICKKCTNDNLRVKDYYYDSYHLVSLDDIKSCEKTFEVEADF